MIPAETINIAERTTPTPTTMINAVIMNSINSGGIPADVVGSESVLFNVSAIDFDDKLRKLIVVIRNVFATF